MIEVRLHGVRGSLPVTGAACARYGGNTPCVEIVTCTGRRLILDAGTGIVRLGRELAAAVEPLETDLLLTHFHWDHIQGLPFFAPLRDDHSLLRVHAPRQGSYDARLLLGPIASPAYMPVPLHAFGARIEYVDATDETWQSGTVEVSSARVHHPSHTRAYRIDCDGVSVAYVPDNELTGSAAETPLRELIAGVDLLIHDAMFTVDEYPARLGWGHSTPEAAAALARDARVGMLCLFHHDPERDDDALDALAAALEDGPEAAGLRIAPAQEGSIITLRRDAPAEVIPRATAASGTVTNC